MKIPNIFSKNFWKYFYFKVIRQPGTPESIARGVAIGLAVGLIIPFGLQLAVAIPLALLLKASKVLSCLFTLVTNQVTIFFIYPVQCLIGSYLIFQPLRYAEVKHAVSSLLKEQSYHALMELGWQLTLSFFAGGTLFALLLAVPGYFVALSTVRRYRALREARRAKRLAGGGKHRMRRHHSHDAEKSTTPEQ